MRIHIIVRDVPGERDRILPRLARLLVSATGWTMGGQPDLDADLNYAMPYLDARHWKPQSGQPLAGYFTHREDILPPKVRMWKDMAARSVLRITSARQYVEELSAYGPTRLVAPPLDREHFSPAPSERRGGKLVAGVSGFTYSGGRKGEKLLGRLLRTDAGALFDWRAIGRGWPVHTKRIGHQQLPDWYRSLDLYVCPSLIEGIPYGPLEALACGVPVVIPRGVGLLDELPDVIGIFRYDCGDADSLTARLLSATEYVHAGTINREELRAATEPFTEEGWITGHLEAFASLEESRPGSAVSPRHQLTSPHRLSSRDTSGVYVVAFGEPARKCAERLITSVHRFMPNVQVAVASDSPLGAADINVYHADTDLGGRTAKTKMWELAPREWKQVLYLDADTEVTADVSFLFDALAAGWEMVCTKDVNGVTDKGEAQDYDLIHSLWRRDSKEYELGWQDIGSDRALQLAGGVVGFRRTPAVEAFLNAWYEEWYRLARRDQGALLRALYRHPVRLLVLGNEWNSFDGIFRGVSAGILHHRGGPARRHAKWGQGRLDNHQAFGGGNGVRQCQAGNAFVRNIDRGVGVRQRMTLSGKIAVVTYVGASKAYNAAGMENRVYMFHKGEPLRVYAEDVAEVTREDVGCWIVEQEAYDHADAMRGVGVRE